MRVDRLVIEAGDNTLGVDFHPKLTVIAGVGKLEREGLVSELVGALGAARPGVHLEVEDHKGRHLAVFRPTEGRHRVVDADRAKDISAEFVNGSTIDLLCAYGLDVHSARKLMLLSSDDLRLSHGRDEAIQSLAGVDQQRLWRAAERMLETEGKLQTEADATGTAPEDVAVIEKIEERHLALEQSIEHYEKVRQAAFAIGAFSGIAGLLATVQLGVVGLVILLVGLASAVAAIVFRRRVTKAQEAEDEALAEAGAQSYLGFHLQRVNGLLSNDQHRKRLMMAAESNRDANNEWRAVAGDITVEFAMKNRESVLAAARVQRDVDALETLSTTTTISRDVTTDLAQVLVTRLGQVRQLGLDGAHLPLVLDDAFAEVDRSVKPLLLELLSTTAGSPQIIFLTEDEDVASWARLEALTGDVSILEPQPVHDVQGAGQRSQPV